MKAFPIINHLIPYVLRTLLVVDEELEGELVRGWFKIPIQILRAPTCVLPKLVIKNAHTHTRNNPQLDSVHYDQHDLCSGTVKPFYLP